MTQRFGLEHLATFTSDNSGWVVVFLLPQLGNCIQLFCASKEVVGLDAFLECFGADQRPVAAR